MKQYTKRFYFIEVAHPQGRLSYYGTEFRELPDSNDVWYIKEYGFGSYAEAKGGIAALCNRLSRMGRGISAESCSVKHCDVIFASEAEYRQLCCPAGG